MAEASATPNFVPIATAAAESLLPERTLYRLVSKGRLTAQKSDTGAQLVDMNAVKALSAARVATAKTEARVAAAVPANMAAAGNGGKVANGRPPEADGELAARLFKAFSEGITPQQAVIQERVPASLVLDSFRQFSAMASAGGNAPSWQKVAAELREKVESLGRYMSKNLEQATWTAQSQANLALERVEALQAEVAQLRAQVEAQARELQSARQTASQLQNYVVTEFSRRHTG